MKISIILTASALFISSLMSSAMAEVMIFPAKGQSAEQTEKDKFACYNWGKQQSGFDPMAVPKTSTPPPSQQQKSGGVVRGGLGGAVLGAVIGDSSKSAGRGAIAGGLIGGVRQSSANNKTAQKTQEWEQREAGNYANNRDRYNRAYAACLEGKGYTVK